MKEQQVRLFAIMLFAISTNGIAGEETDISMVQADESSYVFKPVAVSPSPYGEFYHGRFLFINKGKLPVRVSGFDEPVEGKFEPRFLRYQILKEGVWEALPIGYCATGAMDFAIKPGQEYEFHDLLTSFPEQDTPLTGRIGFDVPTKVVGRWEQYWSQSFVLDWTKDRKSGAFASAKKEHDKKLRTMFSGVGFKEEVVAGEDFCLGIIDTMLRQTPTKASGDAFKPFSGKLEGTPVLELDGKIRIDFSGVERKGSESLYRGTFLLDPRKFNTKWFREAAKRHVTAGRYGNGVEMILDDGSWWDSPLYLRIEYAPDKNQKIPSDEDAKTLMTEMLKILASDLKE
jgi:hypothetical protein